MRKIGRRTGQGVGVLEEGEGESYSVPLGRCAGSEIIDCYLPRLVEASLA